MAFNKVIRQFLPRNYGPVRLRANPASSPDCPTAPATVILKLGEGNQGIIVSINYRVSVENYMTKQQRELCDTASVDDQGNQINPEIDPEA